MKKTKTILLTILTVLIFTLFCVPTAYADVPVDYDGKESQSENEAQTSDQSQQTKDVEGQMEKKKTVKSGGVPLKIKEWDIDKYDPVAEELNFIEETELSIANMSFGINKLVVQVVDEGMETFFTLEVIDTFADDIETISKALYDTLGNEFAVLLCIICLGIAAYDIIAKRNARAGTSKILKMIFVLCIATLYFSNTSFYLKTLNNVSNELQGVIMSAGTKVIDICNDDSTDNAFSDAGQITDSNAGTVAIMRNLYFNLAIETPYYLMNYGTTDKSKINKKEGLNDMSRTDTLLSFKLTHAGKDAKETYVKKYEIGKNENAFMEDVYVNDKIIIALTSIAVCVSLGIIFLGIAFLNFFLQIMIIAVAYILPLMLIISLLPMFSNSAFSAFGQMFSLFIMKTFLSLVVLFVYMTSFLIATLIPITGKGSYFLYAIALIVVFFLMYKKRDKLLRFMTAGKVSSTGGAMGDIKSNITDPAKRFASRRYNRHIKRPFVDPSKRFLKRKAWDGVKGMFGKKKTNGKKSDKDPNKPDNPNEKGNKDLGKDPNADKSQNPRRKKGIPERNLNGAGKRVPGRLKRMAESSRLNAGQSSTNNSNSFLNREEDEQSPRRKRSVSQEQLEKAKDNGQKRLQSKKTSQQNSSSVVNRNAKQAAAKARSKMSESSSAPSRKEAPKSTQRASSVQKSPSSNQPQTRTTNKPTTAERRVQKNQLDQKPQLNKNKPIRGKNERI
ncbi:CD3337/EF1877 family mobilome membrane protein [Listeria costaricensis]|uniref:CD3337/EF1877 family mobilome membrane protein n=1 Tax=Listeria costaricensis TaxID=2026604 RepID=UPI000C089565|nr:hypothetical protein [Listeria costaricensis]